MRCVKLTFSLFDTSTSCVQTSHASHLSDRGNTMNMSKSGREEIGGRGGGGGGGGVNLEHYLIFYPLNLT